MKAIINIFFFVVVIVLSSCTKNETLTNNLEIENITFAIEKSPLQNDATFELNDTLKEITESSMKYEDLVEHVTTLRIHEHLPELTFTRIVNNTTEMQSEYAIPQPVQINIKIEDSDGNIIQSIPGLSQSKSFLSRNLTFNDYNFDGYLDMRLMRWQDGAGGLLANEYFWLWNAEIAQFVLNEQLMMIGQATALSADQETRQIVVTHRDSDSDKVSFYEYLDGEFVEID